MIDHLNLYKDPLTGMSNYFALLDCDLKTVFGSDGIVLYFDLKSLTAVNADFGRDVGDSYIKYFSEIITFENSLSGIDGVDISAYRLGGDAFIVKYPSTADDMLDLIAERTNDHLSERMMTIGVEKAGVRYSKWQYNSPITTVSYLLRQCNKAYFDNITGEQNNLDLPQWADYMIDNTLYLVKQTLSLLQDSNSLVLKDEISQLPNHRAAEYHIKDAFDEYSRTNTTFSILFIDGDNLKKFNDLGYRYGNEMIKTLGDVISSVLRNDDRVFRWLSGDEFLVLLRKSSKEEAYIIAERIRKNVAERLEDLKYPVTISIGVSNCPVDGSDYDTIISVAEMANLKAKRLGKNCVV